MGTLRALVVLVFWSWALGSHAISWGSPRDYARQDALDMEASANFRNDDWDRSRLPNVYAVAMRELQDLESEPLCHRTAARLLVNNCQVLNGKDDATILMDSGRHIRDFVDSYAASLAICDLSRGSFSIPSSCAKFQEDALAAVTITKQAHLHVSSEEIDACLSGLAESDSAWNTWISYRHKSLRFCEAARSDNEKAQSIRLHQRLTEVLSKLTEGVETDLEQRAQSINVLLSTTEHHLGELSPHVERLQKSLLDMQLILSEQLTGTVENFSKGARKGLNDAATLQDLLASMIQIVVEHQSFTSAAHEQSLQMINTQTDHQVSAITAIISSAFASMDSLQNQMGLDRLLAVTEKLSDEFTSHAQVLTQAQLRSDNVLKTLDQAATTAAMVHKSFSAKSTMATWWPYIICPTLSLIMGSYGLEPSALRNLWLIAIGEAVGVGLASAKDVGMSMWANSGIAQPPNFINETFAYNTAEDDISPFISAGLQRQQLPSAI